MTLLQFYIQFKIYQIRFYSVGFYVIEDVLCLPGNDDGRAIQMFGNNHNR